MNKQLVITLHTNKAELEITDFFMQSSHSPEWVGCLDNWEIKSFTSTEENSKAHHIVTALLSNSQWKNPSVTPVRIADLKKFLINNPNLTTIRLGYFPFNNNFKETGITKTLVFRIEKLKGVNYLIISMEGERYTSSYSYVDNLLDPICDLNFEGSGIGQNDASLLPIAMQLSENEIFPIIKLQKNSRNMIMGFLQDYNLMS